MTPVIEAKRAALSEYKRTPSERNLQILRIARSKAHQTARRCANEYWTELSEKTQSAAITGNIRGMYDGIKKALGPTLKKTAPLRSSTGEVITDRGHQLERWVEHYSDIYSRKNTVLPSALDAELDTEPTLGELSILCMYSKIIIFFKNKREREERLQQLQRHLPSQRHWQSLC